MKIVMGIALTLLPLLVIPDCAVIGYYLGIIVSFFIGLIGANI